MDYRAAERDAHKASAQETEPVVNAKETRVEKNCDGITYRITAGEPSSDAGSKGIGTTKLFLIDATGTEVEIDKPAEMSGYTAVGLGCAIAESDSKPYFVVQYGELPYSCKFCEWFYLYDGSGRQLTSSTPPILVDGSLPADEQQTPNTREYSAALEKLGISHPQVEYVQQSSR